MSSTVKSDKSPAGNEARSERMGRIPDAITDIRAGKILILVDDANRENEGDLVFPAQHITPEVINFYETHARGWICVPMAPGDTDRLELPLMVERNTERHGTAFTVTVDAACGTSTGISAADQARTIRILADPNSAAADLLRPGHVRPLRARTGGVLERTGHTEAAVDFMRLAGLNPAAVICEIKKEDGSMARLPDLFEYAERFDLRIYTIEDLVAYRMLSERLIKRVVEADVKTRWGMFRAMGYQSTVRDEQHLALVYGDLARIIDGSEPPLVRVHHSHVLCDIFGVQKNGDCARIDQAMRKIVGHGSGVFIYIRSMLRGQRMLEQLGEISAREKECAVEEACDVQLEHDKRDYGLGAQIIRDLGLKKITVITDHPMELVGMAGYGIEIAGHEPLSEK